MSYSGEAEDISGVIGVNKPEGWTSFDVVAKLRGMLHIKRIGHSGTLDPMAKGVLVVFIGKAAKACDLIENDDKEYTAGFKLGLCTDTQDITGKVISEKEGEVSLERLKEVCHEFLGEIYQTPPMYSAVKVNGKKLYQLAREGKDVQRQARKIFVSGIEILSYDSLNMEGTVKISCKKGTYVRTLINDIGEKLGVGGVMTSLTRTYSGGISLENCYNLEEISYAVENGNIEKILIATDRIFSTYEKIRLGEWESRLYKNGVGLYAKQVYKNQADDKIYRVYSYKDEFLGLGYFKGEEFRSKKNFF